MFDSLFTRSGLSLDRLRSFHAFAEAGSIVKASGGDVSRQALISRQIRELEEFFATELTTRRGKTLSLTPSGRRLADLIHAQLHDMADFQAEQNQQFKTFTLGAGASILEWLVIPAAAQIRQVLNHSALQMSSQRSLDRVNNVRDGRLDFAIVREDAIPAGAPRLPLLKLQFHLCAAPMLLGTKTKQSLADPAVWKKLPFVAHAGGGQLDAAFRQAMQTACGSFQPIFECDSLLQVRELIVQGSCAGILPSIGTRGLAACGVLVEEFTPLKRYSRRLALHWNERQMRRRGVEEPAIKKIAKILIA